MRGTPLVHAGSARNLYARLMSPIFETNSHGYWPCEVGQAAIGGAVLARLALAAVRSAAWRWRERVARPVHNLPVNPPGRLSSGHHGCAALELQRRGRSLSSRPAAARCNRLRRSSTLFRPSGCSPP